MEKNPNLPGQGRAARGRARGRARGQPVAEQQQQPQPAAQPSRPVAQAQQPAPRAAYRGAERPGGLQQRQVEHASAGLTGLSISGNNNNGSNGKTTIGRGQLRGRREIGAVYMSRPEDATLKIGQGEKASVIANYYEFRKKAQWSLLQYHVDILPEEDRTFERKKMVRNHKEILKANFIFDGTSLFTTDRFSKTNKETIVKGKKEDGTVYQITFTYIKELHHFDSQYIQILNLILRRCQEYIGLKLVGRNFYDPKGEKAVPQHKLVIWPGFQTSIRHHEESILMNVDVSHKIIRQETVLSAMFELRAKGKNEEELLGCIVMTRYNSRTYRVDQIDKSLRPSSLFPFRNAQISYNDYFMQKYQLKIRDQNQPLLKSIPKERDRRRGDNQDIILVPELCTMTGISDEMKSNFHTMKDIGEFTKPDPMQRVATLQTFNRNLRTNEKVQEELRSWNLELSDKLVEINGHLALPEHIYQGAANDPGRKFAYNRQESDWSRVSRGKRLNEAVRVEKWAVIYPSRYARDIQAFVADLCDVAPGLGMHFSQPRPLQMNIDNIAEYVRNMKNICSDKQCELVMAVLPNNRSDRYGALKREMCNSQGIPSQFILSKTIGRPNRKSIATKVAIQINCKLGGEPWSVEMPLKAMFVGYDVNHHSSKKNVSFGATVASYNKNASKYFGTVQMHANKEELSSNFYQSIKAAMSNFQRINNLVPPYIFIYRDGVGDSQIEYVKEIEIKAIRTMLAENYGEASRPKIVFIIVSKRINTRVFTVVNGAVRNPLPGTVVDNIITLPERYDFFLVSQAVRQGTVSPTSYNIIENESTLTADQLQRISYKMCHLYYNWQGTVTVPAPCMYAHKLAFMSGTATHEKVHQNLDNKLWFL